MAIDLTQVTTFYPGFEAQWGIEQYLYSAQGNDIEHSRKADKIDGSGFGTRVKNNIPGMMDGSLKIKGMAVQDRGALGWQLNQWLGRRSAVNAWFALEGLQYLAPITMQPSSVIDASLTAKLKDANGFSLELDARGAFDDGTVLLSPATLLSGASGAGLLDNNTLFGGATTTGCTAQLHVWAFDGGTNPSVTVTVQHSPDGITWTNLVNFPTLSTLTSRRIVLPSTTTVNAYTQAIWSTSGSPMDVQVLLGFSRGVDLNI